MLRIHQGQVENALKPSNKVEGEGSRISCAVTQQFGLRRNQKPEVEQAAAIKQRTWQTGVLDI